MGFWITSLPTHLCIWRPDGIRREHGSGISYYDSHRTTRFDKHVRTEPLSVHRGMRILCIELKLSNRISWITFNQWVRIKVQCWDQIAIITSRRSESRLTIPHKTWDSRLTFVSLWRTWNHLSLQHLCSDFELQYPLLIFGTIWNWEPTKAIITLLPTNQQTNTIINLSIKQTCTGFTGSNQ